jgi:23S rRNA pseudouridine1911/1915/1917 synthase
MAVVVLEVTETGGRLDKYVAQEMPELSRSRVQRLIDAGLIRVNGVTVKPSYTPTEGDFVRVEAELEVEPEAPEPQPMALDIVYEDQALMVINKPAGLVVHPGAGHPDGTLVNALLAYRPELAEEDMDPKRPGIVHRLDQDTSGLLIVAATAAAQRELQRQFRERTVDKRYLALVHGRLTPERAAIEAPIGRHPRDRTRMSVRQEGGRYARTEYQIREYLSSTTYLEAHLLTGRTHQLRVHFAAINHPIVGDEVYGMSRERIRVARQFLHAWRLRFRHPVTGEAMEFEAPLADDLEPTLARLRREAGHLPEA